MVICNFEILMRVFSTSTRVHRKGGASPLNSCSDGVKGWFCADCVDNAEHLLVLLLKHSFREEAAQYSQSSVVLLTEIVKLSLCMMVVTYNVESSYHIVREISKHALLWLPSLLYVIQNNLLLFGACRLSPVEFIICSQSKILTTAVM